MSLSSLQKDTINALLYMENDVPNTITISGSSYPAVVSLAMQEKQLGIGGYTVGTTANITVRLVNADSSSLFTTMPTTQQLVTYNGITYRILQIRTAPQGTHMRLVGINQNRGI